ncbi:MAG TPA: hypothetical protein VNL39_13235 [Xanthobacteraceae bacterium]|nr:hypothetical protein [Xanthobacteraceae bacterium]
MNYRSPGRMRVYLLLALGALLGAGNTGVWAQVVGVNPSQAQICSAFGPIRQEVEQVLVSIKAANERKAPREEFCQLFQRLAGSTSKVVKFFEQNKTVCGIPDEAIRRAKADHSQSVAIRKQACAPAPPSGPSLSDILGGPILPDSSSNRPNVGTFNTLTGNPLTR